MLVLSLPASSHPEETKLAELEFKDASLTDAIRIIAELSGHNIVATPSARDTKVTVFLRDITVNEAIKTICKVSNLWFRRDPKTHSYRIMTNTEYSQDLIIHSDDETRVFTVRNPNIQLIADSIANLYGERVQRSDSGEGVAGDKDDDEEDEDKGAAAEEKSETINLKDSLSIDQLSVLDIRGNASNSVSAGALQAVSNHAETIYVTVVAEHNLVVVRTGDRQALKSIAQLIKQLDRPVPQVLLEMKVMDVLIGDDFNSVFNFSLTDSGLTGNSTNPISLGNAPLINGSLAFEFLDNSLQANIEFLQEEKRIKILSTPMVMAANNRPAKLFVGDQQVMVTGYTSEVTTVNGDDLLLSANNIVPTTSVKEIGNTITITPYINADNTITLTLNQESSTIKNAAVSIAVVAEGQVLNLPLDTITTANLKGTVIAKDGLTVAVGGLVRETRSQQESKVPWLADIPYLGWLFTSVQYVTQRSELILMITPHVMSDPGAPAVVSLPTEPMVAPAAQYRCFDLCQY